VKKEVLVAWTLVQQKNGQAYVKVVNLKEYDQRSKKGDVIAKSERASNYGDYRGGKGKTKSR